MLMPFPVQDVGRRVSGNERAAESHAGRPPPTGSHAVAYFAMSTMSAPSLTMARRIRVAMARRTV